MSVKTNLITGGAGLAGSAMAHRLIAEGEKVVIIDDLSRGKIDFVHPSAGFIQADLQGIDWPEKLKVYPKIDLIFHFAARVGGVNYMLSNELASLKNAAVDWQVLQYAAQNKIPLLYVSTACVYPVSYQTEQAKHPPLQEQEAMENTQPESIYGWCKLTGELAVARHVQESKLPWYIVRMFNLYGPREVPDEETGHVIPSLISKCLNSKFPLNVWGSGKQFRSFLYVDDAIDGILSVVRKGKPGMPYNISTMEQYTIKQLAEVILNQHFNGHVEPNMMQFDTTKPEGVFGRSGNTSLIEASTGWTQKTSLEEGIKKTYEWCVNYLAAQKKV